MSNEFNRELYIFGKPIETNLGKVRFLTYEEYLVNIQELSMISLNVLHIYYQYRKMFDENDVESMKAIESIKDESLYSIVLQTDNFREAYIKIFGLVLEENDTNSTWSELLLKSLEEDKISEESEESITPLMKALELIFSNEELFMYYRELVMDMNMLSESEVSQDKIVQEFIEKSNRAKQKNSEKQSVIDLASSVVVGSGIFYEDLARMSVLQIYATYYRIGAMKSYDTTILFSTVSEKVTIEAWNKSIDLFERQSAGIKASEFNSTFGGLFK